MRKPYSYRKIDEDYGEVWSHTQQDSSWRIVFSRKSPTYTGWDCDRHRFIVRAYGDKPNRRIPGTWRYRVYGG